MNDAVPRTHRWQNLLYRLVPTPWKLSCHVETKRSRNGKFFTENRTARKQSNSIEPDNKKCSRQEGREAPARRHCRFPLLSPVLRRHRRPSRVESEEGARAFSWNVSHPHPGVFIPRHHESGSSCQRRAVAGSFCIFCPGWKRSCRDLSTASLRIFTPESQNNGSDKRKPTSSKHADTESVKRRHWFICCEVSVWNQSVVPTLKGSCELIWCDFLFHSFLSFLCHAGVCA